ncbi:MAG TPA: histidine kinase [Tissierellaceae bacterium]
MRRFIEKAIIILFCLFNTYKVNPDLNLVFYFLVSLIISVALDLIPKKQIRFYLYICFLGFIIYDQLFVYYIPLILYNLYLDLKLYSLLALLLLLLDFSIINLICSVISVYLSMMRKKFEMLLWENKTTRDELKEDAIYLKKYNEQLKKDREKNIQIAILTERNRIARKLHDSIGHMISSSILQVEALKAVADDNIKESLNILQNTLINGMNDIRNNIHNLYNESFDLKSKIEELCDEISNLEIKLTYKLEDNLPYELKFDILSVVKEAITNCVKHSNATQLKITLMSQPKFHSIVIMDNGSKVDNINNLSKKGIGLLSMKEIASKYNGFINYGFDNGFRIHMTLMKG